MSRNDVFSAAASDPRVAETLEQAQQELGFDIPVETVPLPSLGKAYPPEHPLHLKNSVDIRAMTAREEDILTSPNLIQQGIALDVLLKSLIVDKSINLDDMIVGDKNAVLVGARILGYGKNYECTIGDEEAVIDLTSLKEKWFLEPSRFSNHAPIPTIPNHNSFFSGIKTIPRYGLFL